MSGIQQAFAFIRSSGPVIGQQAYTSPGTYSWTAPAGVTSVSVVCVGSVRQGVTESLGGAGLGYTNNYTVVPGNSYSVVVGSTLGSDSYFVSTATVKGGGTSSTTGGTKTGTGGGNGGNGYAYDPANYIPGAGGAGGYAGAGGDGGIDFGGGTYVAGNAGAGGGGGGSASSGGTPGGGGVGILGQGSNGAGGNTGHDTGYGGSGGTSGSGANGGLYGGGNNWGGTGGGGAVRIIWPGNTRSFPSTNTGNL